MTSRGGCHCGRVRFEVRGECTVVLECNCSICTMKGYLHWIVPRDAFTVTAGDDVLGTYRFGTGVARHRFCTACGAAPFYISRSDPDKVDVNARCVDDLDPGSLARETFDGRDWEQAFANYRLDSAD